MLSRFGHLIIALQMYFGMGIAQNVEFDKDYFGVVFHPYTKFEEGLTDFTTSDFENLLQIVTKRFRLVSTYGMGIRSSANNWDKGYARLLSALAASHINIKTQSLQLILNIGTQYYSDEKTMNREISDAFSTAEVANANFLGTVSGVIINDTDVHSVKQMKAMVKLLQDNVNTARNFSVGLGTISNDSQTLSESLSDVDSNLGALTAEMLHLLNFIICNQLPNTVAQNVSTQVGLVGEYFLKIQKGFQQIKPNLIVIGETAWPSFDTFSQTFSTKKSLKYWLEMAQWARLNKFRINMYSAFDKYEIRWSDDDFRVHSLYYGRWKLVKNGETDDDIFQEQITYSHMEAHPSKSVVEDVIGIILWSITFLGILGGLLLLFKTLIVAKKQLLLTETDIEGFEIGIRSNQVAESSTEDSALRLPYDRRYEISRKNLLIDASILLGKGNFGTVYRGRIKGRSDEIAIKVTRPHCTAMTLKSMLSEIKIMIYVGQHPNVVSIISAYTGDIKKDGMLAVFVFGAVMFAIELCTGGSLQKRLRDYQATLTLPPSSCNAPTSTFHGDNFERNCKYWSYEIACGMEHIALKNVIHADLATRNVLLTANGTAKITDFGLSRRLYEYTNYVKKNQEPLPWRWMAIESLKTMTFSTKSDVWSYSVTLFEIFSLGDTPYPGLSWNANFANELENGLRMAKPNLATAEIYSTMCDCWKADPAERPSFSNLARFFNSILYESAEEIQCIK